MKEAYARGEEKTTTLRNNGVGLSYRNYVVSFDSFVATPYNPKKAGMMIVLDRSQRIKQLIIAYVWHLLLLGLSDAATSDQSKAPLSTKLARTITLHYQGNLDIAVTGFKETLKISRQKKDRLYVGKCLFWLGVASWDIGKMQDSYDYFNQAAHAFFLIGDRISQEFCLRCRQIVEHYFNCKANREARQYYSSLSDIERGLLLGRELGLPDFELKLLRQKSLVYWQLGDLDFFLETNQRGLSIAERLKNQAEKVKCLNNIGIYFQKRHEYSQALLFFENALSQIGSEDQVTWAECANNLGILYRDFGNIDKSLEYLATALALDKKRFDDRAILIDLENIGSTYLQRGLSNENAQDLKQALSIFKDCVASPERKSMDPILLLANYNNIGIIKSELREFVSAREYYIKALELALKEKSVIEVCFIQNNIASSYYMETNIDQALIHYRKAFALGLNSANDAVVLESCLGIGQCYETAKRPEDALPFYIKAVGIIEKLMGKMPSEYHRAGFARRRVNAYRRIVKILSEGYFKIPSLSLLDEIHDYIDRSKARAFYEGISEAQIGKKLSDIPGFIEKERAISLSIQKIRNCLSDLNISDVEREKVKLRMKDEEEKYLRLVLEARNQQPPYDPEAFREVHGLSNVRKKLLDKKTALIEFYLDDNQSYLIYISKNKSDLFKLSGNNIIQGLVTAFLKVLKSSETRNGQELTVSKQLFEEIIPPEIRSDLNDKNALIIVPDGILFNLPFEALPSIREEYSSYLIEDLAISYCPSVSSLVLLKYPKKQKVATSGLLALGGIAYGIPDSQNKQFAYKERIEGLGTLYNENSDLSPLPFSIKEVIEIGKQFPRNKRTILTGESASEGVLKRLPLENYRFIHFACHGIQDEKHPFQSSLVLSKDKDKNDDGFLQVREIYGLDIKADLVVLSACQTGAGLREGAEGPISLARPFFFAGAHSVISSLWKINDKATVTFMKEFYKIMLHGHSTTKALQLTKIKLIRSIYSSPLYWASFVLNGDPASVTNGF
jgi:CHAT domain-containing protein/Tfp pilus assembly protein PilF